MAERLVVPGAVTGRRRLDAALLLVEDDAADALLFTDVLEESDLAADVHWCTSLDEARRFLSTHIGPVCVLLDLHLPDVRGLDAVRQVLAAHPDAAIVVLTGLVEGEAGHTAVAEGAQDYLVKGRLDAETLSRAVRYAVQRKQVEQTSVALHAGRLRAEENARLELGLLPVPLMRGTGFEVDARYDPGREQGLLSGDFYDVVQTADGTVHAVIGDVSGHGAAEAALGVCLRVAWRAAVLSGCTGPAQIRLLEEIMAAERSAQQVFATLTSLVFPPDRRSVRVVRAGHPGLLVRGPSGTTWYDPPGGMALGIAPGTGVWPETDLPLEPGTGIVVFTDGLFEGLTGPRTRLGENGLLALAREYEALPAHQFVQTLVQAATDAAAPHGGLADDIAVLHLAWGTG
ncbi:PP2C family protein-serine/threonine phosphatase [Streptomyces candidus]|uniref:Serine phosphatase RsbU (Regulator of sigma subunit) n=1 Tax=Streptomyces candidus TaxID=67283 RepID=A0A7X0HAF6_9ACTN|nr:fused response regulator/phosphatase [Streptomyces candidus]MBB6434061.1 serine phosphatase RsbU (regulator of sigma subunit) [Streptomyces candidus]GHH33479.1 fused response regulator/phosphatase [Streptomyces candidus]